MLSFNKCVGYVVSYKIPSQQWISYKSIKPIH